MFVSVGGGIKRNFIMKMFIICIHHHAVMSSEISLENGKKRKLFQNVDMLGL